MNQWKNPQELDGVPMDATASPKISVLEKIKRKKLTKGFEIPDIDDPAWAAFHHSLVKAHLRAKNRVPTHRLLLSSITRQ